MANYDLSKDILNEGRIILLGDPAVGKTSILSRILTEKLDTNIFNTQNLEIVDWRLKLNNNQEILIRLLDFGGQEFLYSTNTLFFSKNSLYIIVTDGKSNDSESNLEIWLNIVKSIDKESTILIVLNKSDLRNYEVNRREILENHPQVKGFFNVSAATGSGIAELKEEIIFTVQNLSSFRNLLPETWIKIRKRLLVINKNYISFNVFRKICIKNDVKNIIDTESILSYFHDLGIVYYDKEIVSKYDIIIVDLQWLSVGINYITNSVLYLNNGGEFEIKQIEQNLLNTKYFNGLYDVFLTIMESNEICFKIKEYEERFIIPALLPVETPNKVINLNISKSLSFSFLYSFLPNDIIYRFIARTNKYSLPLDRWKFGTLLSFEENTALIVYNKIDRRIDISIIGLENERAKILGLIRNHLNEIHSNYNNIFIEELIIINKKPEVLIPIKELLLMQEMGVSQFPKVIGNSVLNINVREILDSIDPSDISKIPLNIFIVSAHTDKIYRDELEKHLVPLLLNGTINNLSVDTNNNEEIIKKNFNKHLKKADLVLILVSPDLLASTYFHEIELNKIIESSNFGKRIISINIRFSDWSYYPFEKQQIFPSTGQPMVSLKDRDAGWISLVGELKRIADRHRGKFEPIENFIISKLTIENIRSIHEITIDFFSKESNTVGMFGLILGENGVGKSTILRSIAIGLASEVESTALISQFSGPLLMYGSDSGRISIDLYSSKTKETFTIETRFVKNTSDEIKVLKKIPKGFPEQKLFICGYGAGRNSFNTDDIERYSINKTTQTLFDYQANLQNPELSFRRLQGQGISLQEIAKRIDEILILEPGSTIIGSNGIKITGPWGDFVPIGGLSDGYRATLAWVSDLIGWSFQFNSDMLYDEISGIVLIDELEQHLHPRWQRIIVNLLRNQFPKIQFITTTHTPLLAAGASDYSDTIIESIERDSDLNQIRSRRIPNSLVEGKDVNKILLDVFGLLSGMSLKAISQIERFAELTSRTDLNTSEYEELNELSQKLNSKPNQAVDSEMKIKIEKYL